MGSRKVANAQTVKSSLLPESSLHPHVKNGLGALKAKDLQLILAAARNQVNDSLDLDSATVELFPNNHRWDYILSAAPTRELVGLEPHPASDGEVQEVIQKKLRASAYLRDHLAARSKVAKWLWVTRGRVGFSQMERARRILDQNGIEFVGRVVRKF